MRAENPSDRAEKRRYTRSVLLLMAGYGLALVGVNQFFANHAGQPPQGLCRSTSTAMISYRYLILFLHLVAGAAGCALIAGTDEAADQRYPARQIRIEYPVVEREPGGELDRRGGTGIPLAKPHPTSLPAAACPDNPSGVNSAVRRSPALDRLTVQTASTALPASRRRSSACAASST